MIVLPPFFPLCRYQKEYCHESWSKITNDVIINGKLWKVGVCDILEFCNVYSFSLEKLLPSISPHQLDDSFLLVFFQYFQSILTNRLCQILVFILPSFWSWIYLFAISGKKYIIQVELKRIFIFYLQFNAYL